MTSVNSLCGITKLKTEIEVTEKSCGTLKRLHGIFQQPWKKQTEKIRDTDSNSENGTFLEKILSVADR